MKADEILDQGAEKIAAGWCQQAFYGYEAKESSDGEAIEMTDTYCAMGAMRKVAFGTANTHPAKSLHGPVYGEYYKAETALAEVMAEQFSIPRVMDLIQEGGRPDSPLVEFTLSSWDIITRGNDLNAKTKEEVVACMEKAAVNLRSAPHDE